MSLCTSLSWIMLRSWLIDFLSLGLQIIINLCLGHFNLFIHICLNKRCPLNFLDFKLKIVNHCFHLSNVHSNIFPLIINQINNFLFSSSIPLVRITYYLSSHNFFYFLVNHTIDTKLHILQGLLNQKLILLECQLTCTRFIFTWTIFIDLFFNVDFELSKLLL